MSQGEGRMFKEHIKNMRLRMGISQSELARRAGYSHEFISQVERGIKTPSIKALQKIASGLGVPPSALMENHNAGKENEEQLRMEVKHMIDSLPLEKVKVIKNLLEVFPKPPMEDTGGNNYKVFK